MNKMESIKKQISKLKEVINDLREKEIEVTKEINTLRGSMTEILKESEGEKIAKITEEVKQGIKDLLYNGDGSFKEVVNDTPLKCTCSKRDDDLRYMCSLCIVDKIFKNEKKYPYALRFDPVLIPLYREEGDEEYFDDYEGEFGYYDSLDENERKISQEDYEGISVYK